MDKGLPVPLLFAFLILFFFIAFLIYRPKKKLQVSTIDDVDSLEHELLSLCGGQLHTMNRLISHELAHRPGISRKEAVSNAIYRLKRDR